MNYVFSGIGLIFGICCIIFLVMFAYSPSFVMDILSIIFGIDGE